MKENMDQLLEFLEEEDDAFLDEILENLTDEDEKLQLIAAMIERYDYEISFQNEKFVLYLTDQKRGNADD